MTTCAKRKVTQSCWIRLDLKQVIPSKQYGKKKKKYNRNEISEKYCLGWIQWRFDCILP